MNSGSFSQISSSCNCPIAIRFNLLQVCPCVSPFVFAVLFIPSIFMFWAVILHVSGKLRIYPSPKLTFCLNWEVIINRDLKQRRRRRQRGRQKSNRFRLAKQQPFTLFCTSLYRRCTTTTWTQDNNFLFLFLNFDTVF